MLSVNDMSKKVVVAGHICLDITPGINAARVDSISDIIRPGSLLNVGKADIHTGGAVANTGLALKKLGADVTLAGKIGDDEFGRMILEIVSRYDAAEGLIVRPGESTSYSVVIAPPGIDRVFLHHPGANDTFCSEDIPDNMLDGAALLHFGYPPIMKRMYEKCGEELKLIFKRAHDAGAATSLDMASVDPASDAGAAEWRRILTNVLPLTDIFAPSVEELMFMLNREKFEKLTGETGGDICGNINDADIEELAEECTGLGAAVVLIKCGTYGMYLKCSDTKRIEAVSETLGLDADKWSDVSHMERCFVAERVLSATGAGDVSIAAFLASILSGYGPYDCIKLAAAEGACAVTSYDALGGIRTIPDLLEKIAKGWKKTERQEE